MLHSHAKPVPVLARAGVVSLAALALCAPSFAQRVTSGTARGSSVRIRPVQERGPVIEVDLARTVFHHREAIRFQVEVSTGDGSPVTVKLQHPPAGLVFDPVVAAPVPVRIDARWDYPRAGRHRLVFEATDGTTTTRETVVLEIEGTGLRNRFGDVTGDGIPDLVAGSEFVDVSSNPLDPEDVGALYVFAGGVDGTPGATPLASLKVTNASEDDRLGDFRLGDVSGDGVLDVIGIAPGADANGVVDAGAAYVWIGGGGLVGDLAPQGELVAAGATAGDLLGSIGFGNGFHLVDVTADGVLDVVAGAYLADVGAVADTGAIHVWAGGGTFTQDMTPTATLVVPGAGAGDELTRTSGQGLLFGDVTGDAIVDVLAGSVSTGLGGAAYVWAGGGGLTGTVTPHATLADSTAVSGDQLGKIGIGWGGSRGNGLRLVDLDRDGVLDIVAVASWADVGGAIDAGAIHLWPGGAGLVGSVDPTVTLSDPSAILLGTCDAYNALLVGDVTGDGALDVVVGSSRTNGGRGAIYVFEPDLAVSAAPAPTATLQVPGAAPFDNLLDTDFSQPLQLVDLTGDGVLDLLAAAQFADAGGIQNSGAVYTWEGGSGLSGSVAPYAELFVSSFGSGHELGHIAEGGYHAVDVTGDGLLDVVAGTTESSGANNGTQNQSGSVHCWKSGPGFGVDPPLTMRSTAAGHFEELCHNGIRFADVDGDGVRDIIANTDKAHVGGVSDAGAVFVWTNVATLTGVQDPSAWLTIDNPNPSDRLGFGQTPSLFTVDVTGDGLLDIVVKARTAGSGAIFVFAGGAITADTVETARLTALAPGANPGGLGGFRFRDLNGDRTADILQGDRNMSNGLVSSGGFYLFRGGFTSNTTEHSVSTVPTASPGDQLGN